MTFHNFGAINVFSRTRLPFVRVFSHPFPSGSFYLSAAPTHPPILCPNIILGPFQVASLGSPFEPYGPFGMGENRLAISGSVNGSSYEFSVHGAPSDAEGVLVVSSRTRSFSALGGTILVDLGVIRRTMILQADKEGRVLLSVKLPPDRIPENGTSFYLQVAMVDEGAEGGYRFSHGLALNF